ncbi:hypothetical protein HEP73_00799 [Xanthomonas sp. GW]|uniref:hypothetical protein n=1 Tax=Xanthomonas sp. GW TaxID=2724121 RepID=UPI00163B5DF5|nr:hypothetical protein [Xanthomonas sp. GW]QNH19901.1 hypothetical protein HEP73_00799 [Xanthomonas sp. GW]
MVRTHESCAALGTPLQHPTPLRALCAIGVGAPVLVHAAAAGIALASATPPHPHCFQLDSSTHRVPYHGRTLRLALHA